MELSDRKKKILQAVVESYVDGAEPVSSNELTDKLSCSSATIRNEMAELEKIGFIEKTHTSSGRIPSQKGYRYYVDELVRDDDLTVEEMKYIKDRLEQDVNDLEDLTKIATTTLSEITHYTAINVGPDVAEHLIADIKFVLLGSRVLMVVILTDSGIIRESIIKFDEDITNEQIEDLTSIFKSKLIGRPLSEIKTPVEDFIKDGIKTGVDIVKRIINEINKILEETGRAYIEGASNVVDMPEFQKKEGAKEFINVLDSKELVSKIMNASINDSLDDISVYIGNESNDEDMKNFSLVTFNNVIDNKDMGKIGVIGPTRMDYSKVISVMKYIRKQINEDYKKGKLK